VERITRDLEAQLETKNQQLVAEIDRRTKEEKEKKIRDALLESQ